MNPITQQPGVFFGTTLVQTRGSIGGYRDVFVKLKQSVKNDLIFPTFGGIIANAFKTGGKFFAGDLFEFRTDAKGLNPLIYILKTFKIVSVSGKTINIFRKKHTDRECFVHTPCVGDVLMKAPDVIGGSGTAVTVLSIVKSTIGEDDVWAVTCSGTISAIKNDILVEGEAEGSTKMLVKNINSVAPTDGEMLYVPASAEEPDDFDNARYMYTPALGGTMYIHKMSPMPKCVLNLNRSKINGWFRLDWFDTNQDKLADLETRIKAIEAKP